MQLRLNNTKKLFSSYSKILSLRFLFFSFISRLICLRIYFCFLLFQIVSDNSMTSRFFGETDCCDFAVHIYVYISESDWTKPGYRHSCQNKRDAKAMSIVNQVR